MQIIYFFKDFGLQMFSTIIIGYMLGSISFSIIFTKMFQKTDIRSMGSGNAGFTNVLRSAGKWPSILTFVCDFAKGALAVCIGKLIFEAFSTYNSTPFVVMQCGAYLAGLACMIGHIYPCYFGFRGGKGVLTASAMMLIIDWRVFLISISVFLLVFLFSKIISLASISAAVSLPVATFCVSFFVDYLPNSQKTYSDYTITYVVFTTILSMLIGVLVVLKHKSNIERLIAGTEKKITQKKK